MKARPKLLAGLLAVTALAAVVPAVAADVIEVSTPATTHYYYVPSTSTSTARYVAEPTTTYYVAPATTYYTAPTTTYYGAPATTYYTAPAVTEVIYEAPPITVEAPRLTEDQRITEDVVSVLASDPYLSGRIGVETRDQDVNLSGSVTTPGQVRRAVRDAKSVWGVRNVTSEIRPRVGANTTY
jgi:hypothetical protein